MFSSQMVALAANWEPVRIRPGVSFMELDTESVVKLSTGNYFTAVWQSGQTREKPMTIFSGLVNCELESLVISRRTYFDGKNPPLVTDYLTGTLSSDTYKSELSEQEKIRGIEYPVSTTDNGLLIANVCQRLNGLPQPMTEAIAPLRQKVSCSVSKTHFVCREDPVSEALVRSLLVRISQAELVCPLDSSQLSEMANSWLNKVTEDCKSNELSCGKSFLEIAIGGLGNDLARHGRGDTSCSFAQSSTKSAALDNKKKASIDVFNKCASEASAKLDDRTSGADVIAQAVYGKCQQELHPELTNSKMFKDAVMPRLTGMVLESRSKRASPSKTPSKPIKKPVPKPKSVGIEA
jgi:hypothetical protein